jgi:ribosomal protein S12 methylthiotransferase accessory factor YcaO
MDDIDHLIYTKTGLTPADAKYAAVREAIEQALAEAA